jgi:hypothetical protein
MSLKLKAFRRLLLGLCGHGVKRCVNDVFDGSRDAVRWRRTAKIFLITVLKAS